MRCRPRRPPPAIPLKHILYSDTSDDKSKENFLHISDQSAATSNYDRPSMIGRTRSAELSSARSKRNIEDDRNYASNLLVENMLSANMCMENCVINSGHHLAKYRNHENLNLIKSITSKSEERLLLSASKLDSKRSSSKMNSSSLTNSSITRLMECQLCGNFSMDQEKYIHDYAQLKWCEF